VPEARLRGEAEEGGGSDLELVRRFVEEGDRQAFEALARRHLPSMRRFLALSLPDPAEAADAEQEVLVRMFRSLAAYRGESGFRTWIFRLCSTAAADLVRNRARDRSRLRRYAATLPDLDPRPEDEPPFDLERLERARETRRALASLGEPDASLLFLRDAEGLSVEDLSSVFGLREGTVKSRLSRARRRLRGLLEEEGESNPGRMPWGR
jgi:RNA polymerase sigma-70 factor (ECF subfamily)